MEKTTQWPWQKREATPLELERQELEESLRDTQIRIAQAYTGFNSALDSELVESFIYEIQALKARYSYLLRARKALDDRPARQPAAGPLPVA